MDYMHIHAAHFSTTVNICTSPGTSTMAVLLVPSCCVSRFIALFSFTCFHCGHSLRFALLPLWPLTKGIGSSLRALGWDGIVCNSTVVSLAVIVEFHCY